MTRKINFDYEQALDRATALFWQRGYAETGLRDLLKAMEIGEGSFYNTLKSKKNLYLLCVDRYEEQIVQRRMDALRSASTAAEGVRAFFTEVLNTLDDPQTSSPLCMVAAMVSDEVLSQPELAERAKNGLAKVQDAICLRLSEDKMHGTLPESFDPQETAAIITTWLQGLWRMALMDYQRPVFARRIATFLSALGL
ncbi:TetR/AcrR family transcriptional regulator [Cedecea neteri]|uniref:TetR family transcriptional regulator n=1 Tax=Cedecea neteri TaxID=158822 RepID=A0AAN0S2Z7_9ENTR|nr:TetR/AcrR family transcriptional regulator [Cedecea neteri]AIR60439.1 TetR family transcriptional regulator [Cedecea neteri]WNJ79241.1 TetR/AcrR family transcriptional regulator [Cedecea neteri]